MRALIAVAATLAAWTVLASGAQDGGTGATEQEKEKVRRVVQSVRTEVRYCYERHLVTCETSYSIHVVVEPDGGSLAQVELTGPDNPKFVACAKRLLNPLKFPPVSGRYEVRAPAMILCSDG